MTARSSQVSRYFAFAIIWTILLSLARKLYLKAYRKYHGYGDGPDGLPIIGSLLPYLNDVNFASFIGRHYGNKYMTIFKLFSTHCVMINDSKLAKLVFQKKESLDRAPLITSRHTFNIFASPDDRTVPLGFTNGDDWTRRRRAIQTGILKYLTNKYVSHIMQQACEHTVYPYLTALIDANKEWYPFQLSQWIAFNTIHYACFNHSLAIDGSAYHHVMSMLDQFDRKIFEQQAILDSFPFLNYLPFYMRSIKQFRKRKNDVIHGLLLKAQQNESLRKEDNFMNYMLARIDSKETCINEAIVDTFILFAAGANTTKRAIEFAITLTAKHVHVQQRVREEILSVMTDKKYDSKSVNKCPLFRAFVYELLRLSSTTRVNPPRKNITGDINVVYNEQRIHIPKDSNILINMDYIHKYNENEFKYGEYDGADTIYLENWLKTDENTGQVYFAKNESFCLFGYGRRDCVGKTVAVQEISHLIGYLLLNFKLEIADSEEQKRKTLRRSAENFFVSRVDPAVPVKVTLLQ